MSAVLELAQAVLQASHRLDRDRFDEELDEHCWPMVDAHDWRNPIDIWTFNAALYYAETIQEQTPAHLLSGSVHNEWRSAIKADRFPLYCAQEYALDQRAKAVLRNPLMGEIDPFWLMFPNNINLNNWNPVDIAGLMAISAYSSSIQNYKPFGIVLYVHGHPMQWVCINEQDPVGQASQGLVLLAQPLQPLAEHCYKQGTFK